MAHFLLNCCSLADHYDLPWESGERTWEGDDATGNGARMRKKAHQICTWDVGMIRRNGAHMHIIYRCSCCSCPTHPVVLRDEEDHSKAQAKLARSLLAVKKVSLLSFRCHSRRLHFLLPSFRRRRRRGEAVIYGLGYGVTTTRPSSHPIRAEAQLSGEAEEERAEMV